MNVCEQNLTVMMIREHLRDLPQFPLSPDFYFSYYAPGDEKHWFDIHQHTERFRAITPEFFNEAFGHDVTLLRERQLYLFTKDGQAIGTGTAWFDSDFHGIQFGRVHWMAILPEFQGRGLSKPLLSAVCQRLKELGHERVYLRTSTARVAAISLYLKFGFMPLIEKPEAKAIWEKLQSILP